MQQTYIQIKLHRVIMNVHFFFDLLVDSEVRAAPIIIEHTMAPCDSTLNLMRYLDVVIGPRNL